MYQSSQAIKQIEGNNNKGYFVCKIILLIILTVFVVGYVAFSIVNLNYNNIARLNYPTSSASKICNLQYSYTYPLLFIDLSTSIPQYRCVNSCPSGWNQFIITDSQGRQINSISQEYINSRMGGVCWSQQKEQIMKRRGLYYQLNYKQNLLEEFRIILIILAVAFLVSLIFLMSFYCLPKSGLFIASIIGSFIIMEVTIIKLSLAHSKYWIIITLGVVDTLFMIWSIYSGSQKLNQSIKHSNQTIDRIAQGPTSSILIKTSIMLLSFNLINFAFLVLVLFQYICLVSSEEQTKRDDLIYYGACKVWWKYVLLFFQWFVVSNFLKELYIFFVVRFGYQIHKDGQLKCGCFSFNNLLNIVAFSFILILLWLPIKIIQLFKPDGAIIREHEQQTISHKLTKAAYCCCGYFINSIHKYTFNPYLILVLHQQFHDLTRSLAIVQKSYHRHDDKFDKSSLWIYRLSNYIILISLSIGLMSILNEQQNNLLSPSHTIFFYILMAILSVQISRFNMNFWGALVQVTEIISITAK